MKYLKFRFCHKIILNIPNSIAEFGSLIASPPTSLFKVIRGCRTFFFFFALSYYLLVVSAGKRAGFPRSNFRSRLKLFPFTNLSSTLRSVLFFAYSQSQSLLAPPLVPAKTNPLFPGVCSIREVDYLFLILLYCSVKMPPPRFHLYVHCLV